MPKEPFETPQLHELATWESLIQSDAWRLYLKLLEDHKQHLTGECLRCVAKEDFHNAVRHEAKVEDLGKIIDLVKSRLTKLRTGGNNG